MKKARRYNLNVSNIISSGIGTLYTNTVIHSILDSFTSNNNVYPSITIEELKSISTLEYDSRVSAYLNTLSFDNLIHKQTLLNDANVDSVNCGFDCLLNSDFLVYKFLSGIRIINVGSSNGEIQYRLLPTNADPNTYPWQTSPTFLNIDQNSVFTAEIRDYYLDDEICKYSKLISIPLLLPSTTIN